VADHDSGGLPGVIGMRTLMMAARREAIGAGSRDVRAEHLLLALAASGTPAGRALADAGLDRSALQAAFVAEREHSLAAVGMPPISPDRLQATTSAGTPGWGASAREALLAGRRQAHESRRSAQLVRRMEQKAARLGQTARRFEETARQIERGERPGRGQMPHGRGQAPHDHLRDDRERGVPARPGPMSEFDLARAILSTELGTVPRALALAGFDRAALLGALESSDGDV